jgi:RNA polymerase sigma-70 factor (ECF subfamily)
MNRVVQFLRRAAVPAGGEEDGELLRRFVAAREEAAFAGLVRRHGAMVLGVCRRLLDDAHEAEDAFQATFLVLARRAAAVRKQDSVASWLYGVAYRVSLKARAAQRQKPGGEAAEPVSTADPAAEAAWRELRPVIDEELSRLPEKYRAPLILCYLEGKTNEEAARLLGWTKGTVSGRLARARDLLRPRLARRGLALAAGGVVALLAQHGAAPASAALVETTVNAVLKGGLSAPAAALAGGVIRAMFVKKITTLAALVVGLGLVSGGVGLLRQFAPGGEEQPPKGKPGVIFTLPEEPKKEPDDLQKLQGDWQAVALEHNGEKLSAEAVKLFRVVIRGNTITFDPDGNRREASFALSTNNKPKAILLKTDAKTPMVRGIYALEDGRLKVCFDNDEGKATPTEFATKADSGLTLIVLERAGVGRTTAAKPAAEEKRYTFEMRNKPWQDVTEWFADVSGLRYTGKETPPGTFTFNGPKDKQYTIPEIVDIINEALLANKKAPYLLVRRPKQPPAGTFSFAPADEKLPPVTRIDLEELDKFGRTEIVSVMLPLKGGQSADVIAALRKLQSPWGSATTMVGGRRLTLTDTTASVREIIKVLKESDLLEAAAPRTFKGSGSPVRAAAFSPDGNVIWTCAEDGRVVAWDTATGKERITSKTDGNKYFALAVSPDGKHVLIGGTTAAREGKGEEARKVDAGVMALYTEHFKDVWHEVNPSAVRAVAFSPDGKRVAAACDDGQVLIRDAETGKAIRALGRAMNGPLTCVAFSPDGKVLAAGGRDLLVRMYDVATGKELRVLPEHKGPVTAVAFSPDGRHLLTACGDCAVQMWDVATGKEIRQWVAATKGVQSVAFSPDGKLIATGGTTGPVALWDATTGKELSRHEGHKGAVNSVAFSPDGKMVVTAGEDGEVRGWGVGK